MVRVHSGLPFLRSLTASSLTYRAGASVPIAGMEATPIRVWSWLMRPSILDTNFGVRPFTICRMPGANSWSRLIPASPPIVEPKSLNVAEGERAQYVKLRGRALAAEASTPRKYDALGLPSRVKRIREAA